MNQSTTNMFLRKYSKSSRWLFAALPVLLFAAPSTARASFFEGEALDTAADVLTWIVLIIVPIVGVTVFLLIHILPEKIAEKRHHPQAKAIQCLCLLSLAFGGLLWPLAWLWAYSKPVLYRMAYGTDKVSHAKEGAATDQAASEKTIAETNLELRRRIAELEAKLADKPLNG